MTIASFVSETANNPGTGAITLLGPNLNLPCRSFSSAFVTGNVVEYVITTNTPGGQSEEAYGTYNSSTNTLSRTTIMTTAGTNAPINFTGPVYVFSYPPASRVPLYDSAGVLNLPSGLVSPGSITATGSISTSGNFSATGYVASSAHIQASGAIYSNAGIYPHNALLGSGFSLTADANARYINFRNDGWRLQWNNSDGTLHFLTSASTSLWYVTGAGNSFSLGNHAVNYGINYRFASVNYIGFGWDGTNGVVNAYVDTTWVGTIATWGWVGANYKHISAYTANQNVDYGSSPTFTHPVAVGTTTTANLQVNGTANVNALNVSTVNMGAGNLTVTGGIVYGSYAGNRVGFGWDGGNGWLNVWVDNTFVGGLATHSWVGANYKHISTYTPNQVVDYLSSPAFQDPVVNGTLTCNVSQFNGQMRLAGGIIHLVNSGNYWVGYDGGPSWAGFGTAGSWKLECHSDFTVHIHGAGYQPGGGVWQDNSDARIKTVIEEYQPGLAEILRLRPIRYVFNGNDAYPEKKIQGHFDTTTVRTGLIAQEAEDVLPEMVTLGSGYIDGEEVDDMRTLNASCLTYVLINAVKELHAEIQEIKGAIA